MTYDGAFKNTTIADLAHITDRHLSRLIYHGQVDHLLTPDQDGHMTREELRSLTPNEILQAIRRGDLNHWLIANDEEESE